MIEHKDFPQMTENFDARVRQALRSLPEQTQTQRRPLRRMVAVGLVAALCLGGTAFAAHYQNWFPALFGENEGAALAPYVTAPEAGTLVSENDRYKLEVEAVLFDESARAGLVSLHLENKTGDGKMPFQLSRPASAPGLAPQDDVAWFNLAECFGGKDGEYDFNILYGESGFAGGGFYLNEARSTENDYYLEGAFIPSADYQPGDTLRVEAGEIGAVTVDENNMQRLRPALAITLPDAQPMPMRTAADGRITLSQIGLRIQDPMMHSAVDEIDRIVLHLRDGSEIMLRDEAQGIDRTLYTLGYGSSEEIDAYDVATSVLANTFAIENVERITINDTAYPLA